MEIKVTVKTKAARDQVKVTNGNMIVNTKALAKNGLANDSVVSLVARHFNVSPNQVKITKGFKNKTKTLEVKL